MSKRASARQYVRWFLVPMAVVSVAAVVFAMALLHAGHERSHRLEQRSTVSRLALPNDNPLGSGREVTLAQARQEIEFRIQVPETLLASTANLTHIWVDADGPRVALMFDDGKIVIIEQHAPYQDAAAEYTRFLKENDAKASVGKVGTDPALEIQPGTDVPHANPAWVEFAPDGIMTDVYSYDYSIDQLLVVASSMS